MDGQTHKLLHRLDTHTIEAGLGTANTHLEQWIENERTNGWCWWWIWQRLDSRPHRSTTNTNHISTCLVRVCVDVWTWLVPGTTMACCLRTTGYKHSVALSVGAIHNNEKKEVMLWQQGTTQAVANNFCLDTSFQIYGFSQPARRLGSRQSCNN